MSLNLFIVGPSGCGKSTQAKLIAQKYNLTHLSMGELLRSEILAGSPVGLKAKSFVDQGLWVTNDIVEELLEVNLLKINNQNFIVDGFPRMLNQGLAIEKYLKTNNQPFSFVIHLDVSFEEIMVRRSRLGQEFQSSDRTDNTPAAVAARQQSYNDTINPIKDYFQTTGKLLNIDGNRPVESIFTDICLAIDSLN